MDHDEFETVVREAMANLPQWVHDGLDNVEILVVDGADETQDPEHEGLLGVYTGLPLFTRHPIWCVAITGKRLWPPISTRNCARKLRRH